jgi:hypothetical protein
MGTALLPHAPPRLDGWHSAASLPCVATVGPPHDLSVAHEPQLARVADGQVRGLAGSRVACGWLTTGARRRGNPG